MNKIYTRIAILLSAVSTSTLAETKWFTTAFSFNGLQTGSAVQISKSIPPASSPPVVTPIPNIIPFPRWKEQIVVFSTTEVNPLTTPGTYYFSYYELSAGSATVLNAKRSKTAIPFGKTPLFSGTWITDNNGHISLSLTNEAIFPSGGSITPPSSGFNNAPQNLNVVPLVGGNLDLFFSKQYTQNTPCQPQDGANFYCFTGLKEIFKGHVNKQGKISLTQTVSMNIPDYYQSNLFNFSAAYRYKKVLKSYTPDPAGGKP